MTFDYDKVKKAFNEFPVRHLNGQEIYAVGKLLVALGESKYSNELVQRAELSMFNDDKLN